MLDETYKFQKHVKNGDFSQNYSTRCTTMEKVIAMNGLREIDYLSLDVEGHELKVLQGFPLENFIIKVMTVEGKVKPLRAIEEYLKSFGYTRIYPLSEESRKYTDFLKDEAIFIHKSVKFGVPK